MRAICVARIVATEPIYLGGTSHPMFIAPLFLAVGLSPADPSTEAYTDVQPVAVAGCSVVGHWPAISGSYFGPIVSGNSSLNISFVDRDPKPIRKVEFAVSDGNVTIPVVDEGTFSTGVAVNHHFSEPALTDRGVSCAVRSVAFADGSTWSPAI